LCETRSKELSYDITAASRQVEELKAEIEQREAQTNEFQVKIEELSSSIYSNSADLKAATAIRKKEEIDFNAQVKELMGMIDALGRAIGIMERRAKKGGGSALQIQRASSAAQAINIMVESSLLGSDDANRLTNLIQDLQANDDSDLDLQRRSRSNPGILDTLENLLDKAQERLEQIRSKGISDKHHFLMLKQSLDDETKFGNAGLYKAKKSLSVTAEAKSEAEGGLAMATKGLAEQQNVYSTLKFDCMSRAQDYQSSMNSRSEELKAISTAKQSLQEMTKSAAEKSYGGASLLQFSQFEHQVQIKSSADLATYEVVRFIRKLAEEQHDNSLMQLAHRLASAVSTDNSGGVEPFAKVNQMIRDMLEKLESDAQHDASHKAYCKKQISETQGKKDDLLEKTDGIKTVIDTKTAKSAKLKEDVAELQKGLSDLAAVQVEMKKIRDEEKAEYTASEKEMQEGLQGVKIALQALRDYYSGQDNSHNAAEGAGSTVIGMLEVVESDFSRGITELIAAESTAQADYDKETAEYELERQVKEKVIKYKIRESKQLGVALTEAHSDKQIADEELAAVKEYSARIDSICIAKAEPFAERTARRDAEIAGLKQALSILDGQGALLQHNTFKHQVPNLRGSVQL